MAKFLWKATLRRSQQQQQRTVGSLPAIWRIQFCVTHIDSILCSYWQSRFHNIIWGTLMYTKKEMKYITVQWKESKKTRVGTEKITSGEGHEWFLESPQVKIMFLLSFTKHSNIITVHSLKSVRQLCIFLLYPNS
jgi:hypothetical protein